MSYCNTHGTNSPCVACELQKQTREIVAAIKATQAPPTTWEKARRKMRLMFMRKPGKTI